MTSVLSSFVGARPDAPSNMPLAVLLLGVGAQFCLFSIAMPARAQNLQLANDGSFEAVSGYAGKSLTIGATGGFRGLAAIEWFEDGNDPCKLVLDTKHLNNKDVNQPSIVLTGTHTVLGKQPCR